MCDDGPHANTVSIAEHLVQQGIKSMFFVQPMSTQIEQAPTFKTISENELARLIVETLHLEIAPQVVDPTAPLFGDGLGLDSIDLLEIVLSISKKYGIDLRSEDRAAIASLRALTAHIKRHKTI